MKIFLVILLFKFFGKFCYQDHDNIQAQVNFTENNISLLLLVPNVSFLHNVNMIFISKNVIFCSNNHLVVTNTAIYFYV